jgi:hypothetical protein
MVSEWYLLTTNPSLVLTSSVALSYYSYCYRWNIETYFKQMIECRVEDGTLATINGYCNYEMFAGCFNDVNGRLVTDPQKMCRYF